MNNYLRIALSLIFLSFIGLTSYTHVEGQVKPSCIEAANFECGETPEPSTTLVPTAPPPPDDNTTLYLPMVISRFCDCNSQFDVGFSQ